MRDVSSDTVAQAILVLTGFIVTSVYVARAFTLHSLLELPKIETLSKLINIFGAASDVAIAAAMVYLLRRSRTGFDRSNHIINRLVSLPIRRRYISSYSPIFQVLFVVNTGLLTSVCALCSLVAVSFCLGCDCNSLI
jgi:hypothetical protein